MVHCRADGGGILWWGRPWAAKITAGCWADWKEPCGRAELRHRGLFDQDYLHFYAGRWATSAATPRPSCCGGCWSCNPA